MYITVEMVCQIPPIYRDQKKVSNIKLSSLKMVGTEGYVKYPERGDIYSIYTKFNCKREIEIERGREHGNRKHIPKH